MAYDTVYNAVYDNIVKPYAEPSREKLLPDWPPHKKGTRAELPTRVVSLDGCLIESQWTRQHGWRYIKRPGVDKFLASLVPFYEIVMWTDTMNSGDPVVDRLDPRRLIRHRLYRDTTTFSKGFHRKDLNALNRDLGKVLIIDVDPQSYSFHPKHGIEIPSYKSEEDPDKKDDALVSLVPFLIYLATTRPPDFSAEVEAVRTQYPGETLAAACNKKLAELQAAGKLRFRTGPQGIQTSIAPKGGTVWERLRSQRG
jgi:import inner membrane translocase subunit TIM50